MKREQIKSSNISSVGYDRETLKLEVEFLSGAVYEYEDVPLEVYHNLMDAPSVGAYFSKYIKNNFKYRLVPNANQRVD